MNREFFRIPEPFKDAEFDVKMAEVDLYFSSHLKKKFFESYDGRRMCFYKCEPQSGAEQLGTVVISHGFTEFALKYTEFTYYLINAGFSVYIPEHRCHGESYRDAEGFQLTNIDDFDIYVKDLEFFLMNIVLPENTGGKIFLFGHSMGAAIAGRLLETSPVSENIAGLVVTSPMVSLAPPMLREKSLVRLADRCISEKGPMGAFKYSHDFDPDPSFKKAGDTSFPRFMRNLEFRRHNDCYKNSRATNGWILAACRGIEDLFKEENNLNTDTLVLIGGKDTVIKRRRLLNFAKALPKGRYEILKNAKHSVLTSEYTELSKALSLIFSFLREHI